MQLQVRRLAASRPELRQADLIGPLALTSRVAGSERPPPQPSSPIQAKIAKPLIIRRVPLPVFGAPYVRSGHADYDVKRCAEQFTNGVGDVMEMREKPRVLLPSAKLVIAESQCAWLKTSSAPPIPLSRIKSLCPQISSMETKSVFWSEISVRSSG